MLSPAEYLLNDEESREMAEEMLAAWDYVAQQQEVEQAALDAAEFSLLLESMDWDLE